MSPSDSRGAGGGGFLGSLVASQCQIVCIPAEGYQFCLSDGEVSAIGGTNVGEPQVEAPEAGDPRKTHGFAAPGRVPDVPDFEHGGRVAD